MCKLNFNEPKIASCIKTKRNSLPTKNGGLYKWWCNRESVEELLSRMDLGHILDEIIELMDCYSFEDQTLYCFYVGMTICKKGLSGRIKGKHLSKKGNKSTLRSSLKALGFGAIESLEFLNDCYVSWCEIKRNCSDYKEGVMSAEKFAINENLTIFNINDLDFSNKTKIFKELRLSIVNKIRNKR